MQASLTSDTKCPDLKTPVRNRFFYGKLMDVYHFDLETYYQNSKRWMLNRVVSGFGVVCGLSVDWAAKPGHVTVGPGIAIDKWGREIVVPEKSMPREVPADLAKPMPGCDDNEGYVHIVLCYHECCSDPAPILTGECDSPEPCAPGAIRERYKLDFRAGCAPIYVPECSLPNVVINGKIEYRELTKYVTQCCPERFKDPCIPLANIRVKKDQAEESCCGTEDIEIAVRPVVYRLDLLFDLLVCLFSDPVQPRGGKS